MTKKEDHQQMTCPPPRTLADLRRSANLTQAQLAKRMGRSSVRIAHIEATYPNVRYDTLLDYIQALGGQIHFTVGDTRTHADHLQADPRSARTRAYLQGETSRTGLTKLNRKTSAAKELPLQSDQTDTGGDDPSRDVDHPDTQSNQGDGSDSQEP